MQTDLLKCMFRRQQEKEIQKLKNTEKELFSC